MNIRPFPSDVAQLPKLIKEAPAFQQTEPTDKIMHVWCAGTGMESVHPARSSRPWKYTAQLDKKRLDDVIEQVTSPPDLVGARVAGGNESIFKQHPSVFIISDGRRPSSTKTIMSSATKVFLTRGPHINQPFSASCTQTTSSRSRGA